MRRLETLRESLGENNHNLELIERVNGVKNSKSFNCYEEVSQAGASQANILQTRLKSQLQ